MECVFTLSTHLRKRGVPQIQLRENELWLEIFVKNVAKLLMETKWPLLKLYFAILINNTSFDSNFIMPSKNSFQV